MAPFTKISVLLLLVLWSSACYYDVEEELYPSNGCDVSNVSYSGTVEPIIKNRCYVCHGTGVNLGNVTLQGYDALKTYAQNGKLLGTIKHESGFSPMPQSGGKVPDCEIQKVEKWIIDGMLNN